MDFREVQIADMLKIQQVSNAVNENNLFDARLLNY